MIPNVQFRRAQRRRRYPGNLLLLFFGFFVGDALSQNVVSRPSGFLRIEIPPGENVLLSTPFHPADDSINGVLKDQMTGGDELTADRVIKWDPAIPIYRGALKAGGTGDPEKDDKWFEDFVSWQLSDISFKPGEGFFILNRQDTTQTVFLCGEVVLHEVKGMSLQPGLSLFSYPFASPINLQDTQLKTDGAAAGETSEDADYVSDAAAQRSWLLQTPEGAQWTGEDGLPTDRALTIGAGYWYFRRRAEALVWDQPRPYADLFPSDAAPPRILDLSPTKDRAAITLKIACAGVEGEKLDIYYQDLTRAQGFDSEHGWAVAELDISVAGRKSLSWTDAGAKDRPAIGEVFARCYLVGRSDLDSDGDRVPDCREIFIQHTDPHTSNAPGVATGTPGRLASTKTPGAEGPSRTTKGIIYVDVKKGNDSFDGASAWVKSAQEKQGPKKSINSARRIAVKGDVISVAEGVYHENVRVHGVRLIPSGRVILD